jgi:small multidrug resistance family-3 protein
LTTGVPGTLAVYVAAALAEIGGCFAFWSWVRSGASIWWLVPGVGSLCLFAWLLTLAEPAAAGRAFAAYGGIYVAMAVAWLVLVERAAVSRADLAGVGLCLIGCIVILTGRR